MSFPDYSLEDEAKSYGYKYIVGTDEAGRGCEHPSAEVLTSSGWKFYCDILPEDRVLSYTKTGNIIWQDINFVVEKEFNGDLVNLKNRSIDILVTPDHYFDVLRRTFKRDDSGVLYMTGYTYGRRTSVKNLKNNDFLPRGGTWLGQDMKYFTLPAVEKNKYDTQSSCDKEKHIPMDLWLKFLGIYLSEGSSSYDGGNYRTVIRQIKRENKLNIYKELKNLPFNVCLGKRGIVILNRQLHLYLKKFGYCYNKFIPKDIKNLSSEKLQLLLDWLLIGDGTSYKGKNRKRVYTYYTTSSKLRDDVEEIILKIGKTYKTTIRKSRDGYINGRFIPKENKVSCYEIRIRQNVKAHVRSFHKEIINYKGKVFCLGLPEHHNFYVRRNGSGYFTGNCGAGPVVAAAVHVPQEAIPELIGKVNDSKKMTAKKRDELFDVIKATCNYGIQDISAEIIDEINILEATKLAMRIAVEQVEYFDYILVDGTVDLSKHIKCCTKQVIKGDAKSISIAAASVLAKVTRDRIMIELDKDWGIYNFKKNKGYLVPEHIEALKLYGPCMYHRLTFNKVKDFL